MKSSVVVLIPAFNPSTRLVDLLKNLSGEGFLLLVVNDGSEHIYDKVFEQCKQYATVIGYEDNCGKGHALKFGYEYILSSLPSASYVVTADADGQHRVSDICKVAKTCEATGKIVLTVRDMDRTAPWRSRVGNAMSRFFFALANGRYLPDNQSGLRGFCVSELPWMCMVRGEKYDYELNVVLMAEKQGLEIVPVGIEALYFDGNSDSHFRPLADTGLIYKRFFETNAFVVVAVVLNLLTVLYVTFFFDFIYLYAVFVLNWLVYVLFALVLERYVLFRRYSYTPGKRRLAISIAKYTVYFLICWTITTFDGFVLGFFSVPLIVAYIFAMILVDIGIYFLLKATYDK